MGRSLKCCVYVLTNDDNRALYVGVTDDLQRSVYEHRNKLAEDFTARYDVNRLVYYENLPDMKTALKRKKEIKRLNREDKNHIIIEMNPGWKDLSNELE